MVDFLLDESAQGHEKMDKIRIFELLPQVNLIYSFKTKHRRRRQDGINVAPA
jgi:hypothetical protein